MKSGLTKRLHNKNKDWKIRKICIIKIYFCSYFFFHCNVDNFLFLLIVKIDRVTVSNLPW